MKDGRKDTPGSATPRPAGARSASPRATSARPAILEVGPEDGGRTLQALLHDRANCSHSEAKGLIDAGAVRRIASAPGSRPPETAGARAAPPRDAVPPGSYTLRVVPGERFEIRREAHRRYRPRPQPREGEGFRVVHQDAAIMVVDKQAGLLSVPTDRSDDDSLVERLLDGEQARGVRRPMLFALHRIDRDTSGLLLFARSRAAFEYLQAQFKARTIERQYLAVAAGRIAADEGRIESRLVEDPRTLKVRSTRHPGEGKTALTDYRVLERLARATVLAVRIHTGRKHQIRVHLAEAGHPLVGDARYGRPSPHIRRTALHARRLVFLHPTTGARAEFESDPPRDLRHLVKALRKGADPDR